jgi:lipopolysaccharide/colanic/teichoic acid biosynthesis glycosyltransferase
MSEIRDGMVRRALDVLVASVALLVLSPVLLAVAIVIRWRMGSPVLFCQRRLGRHGRQFRIVKFRTLLPVTHEGQPDHQRLTRLGIFLRATSLDELPQLFNVLCGHMSLIGPRPGLPEHLERYCPRQRGRLAVRPGITGWAQVNGRNSVSLPERIELDLWYLAHRGLRVDLKIVIATFGHLMRPRGVIGPGGSNPDFPGTGSACCAARCEPRAAPRRQRAGT